MNHRHLLYTLLVLGMGITYAHAQNFPAAKNNYTTNGDEVTDNDTGLIWKRCSEGQTWDGSTCTGPVTGFTHEDALKQAKTVAANTGKSWRLPNVKELTSIADKSKISPAINTAVFPNTSSVWYWSSSPYSGDAGYAWVVGFGSGGVASADRFNGYRVRLVR